MENPNTKYLLDHYPEVKPLDFYRDLFPVGELEPRGEYIKGMYNAIAVQIIGKRKARRFTICDDLEPVEKLVSSNDFTIISPVSYAGKEQSQINARNLYAIAFDVDGLIIKDGEPQGLKNLIHQFTRFHPLPTYIVSSGSGIHLYYFLKTPIPLFPNVVKQLREYRKYFTSRVWNEYVTKLSTNPQFESVTQSFRAVGSIAKDGKQRVRAFKIGDRVTIDQLNEFVKGDEKAKIKEFVYKSKLTLDQAREKYPDWYRERIELNHPAGHWVIKDDLYKWWLRQIRSGATVGHRYYCIMALAIYARKCAIPQDQLEKDAFDLLPYLNDMSPVDGSNDFDEGDIIKALDAYDSSYIKFPRDSISELTAIPIQANKRNYRKQKTHLIIARATKEGLKEAGEMKKEGRPSKKAEIVDYYQKHPRQTISEIARALDCDRKTVSKWVNYYKENGKE